METLFSIRLMIIKVKFSVCILCVIWSNKLLLCALALPPGPKRASHDPEEFEAAKQHTGEPVMTEEEREYLRWYYRTEDRKCCCCSSCRISAGATEIDHLMPVSCLSDKKNFKVSLITQWVQPVPPKWSRLRSVLEV